MVKSVIPIPLKCSVGLLFRVSSTAHSLPPSTGQTPSQIYLYKIPGLNFESPIIQRQPGRFDTHHCRPGHQILSISFIPIKTCLREHQLLPLAHHEALQSSTITSSIESTPTTLPRQNKNTHFSTCFGSLFSSLTTIVFQFNSTFDIILPL